MSVHDHLIERQTMQQALLASLVREAAGQPDRKLQIYNGSGAVIATVEAHDLPMRPQDMPRHLRPKQKLSKRGRDAAKRAKLRARDVRRYST